MSPEGLLEVASDVEFFAPAEDRTTRYEAIFVDEVQDYQTEWLRILQRYFLAEDGEFVVFGDEKQNVYDRTLDENKLPNTTIPGRWNELTDSYRLNAPLVAIAQDFQRSVYADKYTHDDELHIVQSDLFGTEPYVAYRHVPDLVAEDLYAFIQTQARELNVHPNDITVVSPVVEALRDLLDLFTAAGERVSHTFETNAEREDLKQQFDEGSEQFKREVEDIRRGRKVHFWMNAGTVKLSTIHSFKGWESHTVVLVLGESEEDHDDRFTTDELVYTAITRARHNLLVVEAGEGKYAEFFARHATPMQPTP